jgi:hypothetical protein
LSCASARIGELKRSSDGSARLQQAERQRRGLHEQLRLVGTGQIDPPTSFA